MTAFQTTSAFKFLKRRLKDWQVMPVPFILNKLEFSGTSFDRPANGWPKIRLRKLQDLASKDTGMITFLYYYFTIY